MLFCSLAFWFQICCLLQELGVVCILALPWKVQRKFVWGDICWYQHVPFQSNCNTHFLTNIADECRTYPTLQRGEQLHQYIKYTLIIITSYLSLLLLHIDWAQERKRWVLTWNFVASRMQADSENWWEREAMVARWDMIAGLKGRALEDFFFNLDIDW